MPDKIRMGGFDESRTRVDPVLGKEPLITLKDFLKRPDGFAREFAYDDFVRYLGPDAEEDSDEDDAEVEGDEAEEARIRKLRGTVQERAQRALNDLVFRKYVEEVAEGQYRLTELGAQDPSTSEIRTADASKAARTQEAAPEALLASVRVSVNDISTELLEELDGKIGSQALRAVDVMVHDAAAQKIRGLGLSEDATTKAVRAVTRKDWAGIEPESKLHHTLREVIAQMNTVKHALVHRWLGESPKRLTGFSEVENLEYKHMLPALAACDRLFIKIATAKQPIDSDERVKRGFTNPWALTVGEGDNVREVSFNEAFPEEMEQMRTAFDALLYDLNSLWSCPPDSIDKKSSDILALKIQYYDNVAHALKTGNAEDWFQADQALPQQGGAGAVLAIHPIEDGYMHDRVIRAPEISLRAPDMDAKRAADMCKETQRRMISSLKNGSWDALPSLAASIDLVTRSSATPRHFFGSGMEMDLKPAGQILPNDLEARIKGGVDTSLDRQSAEERYELLRNSFEAVFGKDSAETIIGKPDFDDMIGGDIASHEFGHAVGLVPDLFKRIDKTLLTPYIEEWKATTGGLVLGYWLPYQAGEVDMDQLRKALLNQVMNAARYSSGRGHPYAKAYYRHSVMLMNTAEKAGVLRKDADNGENPWTIDASDENVKEFYRLLEEEYRMVLNIYASGSNSELRTFLEEKLHTTEFIDFMAARVDAMLGEKKVETPKECLALPA